MHHYQAVQKSAGLYPGRVTADASALSFRPSSASNENPINIGGETAALASADKVTTAQPYHAANFIHSGTSIRARCTAYQPT
jgi:hypothetical protein